MIVEKEHMTKRQKYVAILTLVLGTIYLFVSNHYMSKFSNIFLDNSPILFIFTYVFCLLILFFHSFFFFTWLYTFISSMIEVKGNYLFKKKDRDMFKAKWLLTFKNWVNER